MKMMKATLATHIKNGRKPVQSTQPDLRSTGGIWSITRTKHFDIGYTKHVNIVIICGRFLTHSVCYVLAVCGTIYGDAYRGLITTFLM